MARRCSLWDEVDGALSMIVFRAAAARGHAQGVGVDRRHAFSSGDHHDAAWMGWGALRVLDEVVVAPGAAIAPQRRANMELLTLVLAGTLLHRDGAGADHLIDAGGLQCVGAGRGTDVDERNASPTAPLRMLQAWIQPDRVNAAPRRSGFDADPASTGAHWTTLASPDGEDGSAVILQRAWLRSAVLGGGESIALSLDAGRRYWVQVLCGDVTAAGHALVAGDGLGVVDAADALAFVVDGGGAAELLVFDLPA